jgi:hypothetical protein
VINRKPQKHKLEALRLSRFRGYRSASSVKSTSGAARLAYRRVFNNVEARIRGIGHDAGIAGL